MKAQIFSFRRAVMFLLYALITTWAGTASAQDALSTAKALYNNAAYEEALKILAPAGENAGPEIRQYRAFCLSALGRTGAAQQEFAALITLDPFFVLNARELAPRLVTQFNDTRRKLLPEAVQRRYIDAKTLFQSGNHALAKQQFDDVRRLLDDPMLASDADLKSLRVIVDGYFDLLSSAAPPAAERPRTTPPSAAQTAAAPTVRASTAAVRPKSSVSRPPVTLKQSLPAWRPDPTSTGRVFSGAIKVTIDANGRVTSAVMVRRIHPLYDRTLIEAASGWLYQPATLDGKPVPSEKTVEVEVSPR